MESQVGETAKSKIQRLEAQLEFTHTHYQKLLEQVLRKVAVKARHFKQVLTLPLLLSSAAPTPVEHSSCQVKGA